MKSDLDTLNSKGSLILIVKYNNTTIEESMKKEKKK